MQKYSQIIIDYIQELEMILDFYEEEKNRIDLEIMAYNISNILEVINPALEIDISALHNLSTIINNQLYKAEYL
jgi:hypothetical protein